MKNVTLHHTALARGYVKVGHEVKADYSGRFGKGYTVCRNNPRSTRYCYKSYYIESSKEV